MFTSSPGLYYRSFSKVSQKPAFPFPGKMQVCREIARITDVSCDGLGSLRESSLSPSCFIRKEDENRTTETQRHGEAAEQDKDCKTNNEWVFRY